MSLQDRKVFLKDAQFPWLYWKLDKFEDFNFIEALCHLIAEKEKDSQRKAAHFVKLIQSICKDHIEPRIDPFRQLKIRTWNTFYGRGEDNKIKKTPQGL
ncbi:hypothetical protein B566_EDAN004151 [Ephemera danica]|nr:hypothetical protein B566_EDAN004151 [Ephemera danica]